MPTKRNLERRLAAVESQSKIHQAGLNLVVPECAIDASDPPSDDGIIAQSSNLNLVLAGTPAADEALKDSDS